MTKERKELGSNGRLKGKPKDTRANIGRWTQALRMASHKKAKVKFYKTNSGSSRVVPKAGAITKELRMVAKELDGKPTVECQPRPKHSKFRVSHCHRQGMQ